MTCRVGAVVVVVVVLCAGTDEVAVVLVPEPWGWVVADDVVGAGAPVAACPLGLEIGADPPGTVGLPECVGLLADPFDGDVVDVVIDDDEPDCGKSNDEAEVNGAMDMPEETGPSVVEVMGAADPLVNAGGALDGELASNTKDTRSATMPMRERIPIPFCKLWTLTSYLNR